MLVASFTINSMYNLFKIIAQITTLHKFWALKQTKQHFILRVFKFVGNLRERERMFL